MFLDETGFNIHTSTNYGYSPKNKEALLFQPASKQSCAIIAKTGVLNFKLVEGAYNGEKFGEFLQECYSKNIFQNNPIVIMDNVRFHHMDQIKSFLGSVGVDITFLPPYSPDLNPIEQVFASVKSRLDKMRPRAINKKMC